MEAAEKYGKKQTTKKRTLYDCIERPEEGCRNNKICWIVQ